MTNAEILDTIEASLRDWNRVPGSSLIIIGHDKERSSALIGVMGYGPDLNSVIVTAMQEGPTMAEILTSSVDYFRIIKQKEGQRHE